MKLRIPVELLIVSRKEREIAVLGGVEKALVRSSYAVDASNDSRAESARKWGGDYVEYKWDPQLQRSVQVQNPPPIESHEANAPQRLRIISLEYRGGGGRAYKVLDSKNRLFDLRENVLLEAIEHVGIEAGGYLGGEYIWSLQGSEMKWVRVGSDAHSALLQEDQQNKVGPTRGSKLEIGRLYQNSTGTWVYLGTYAVRNLEEVRTRTTSQVGYRWNSNYERLTDYVLGNKTEKMQLWVDRVKDYDEIEYFHVDFARSRKAIDTGEMVAAFYQKTEREVVEAVVRALNRARAKNSHYNLGIKSLLIRLEDILKNLS